LSSAGPAEQAATAWLFREVNERIRELEGGRIVGEHDFVCECDDDTCTGVVRMTAEEYDAVRGKVDAFAVLPGHERPGAHEVVGHRDGFIVVVEKRAERSRF
jgi:hypothetical protein